MAKEIVTLPAGNHLLVSDIHKEIIAQAKSFGLAIFVVGGYLRDLLLHEYRKDYDLSSKDLDYAIAGGSAFQFADKIAQLLGGHFVALDKENDTARVVMPDGYTLDFAGCLAGSIEEDILRRDFSVNALYLDPSDPQSIIDKVGGVSDIKFGIIRALDRTVFTSDPLRLLRAFRLASNLGFCIDKNTLVWIKENANSINMAAGERISSELFLTLKPTVSTSILPELVQTGLIEAIFSELSATRFVTNNAYHHLNLFDHSVEAVVQTERELLARPDIWSKTNLNERLSPGISNLAVCKLAALLHDIGKPNTWVITNEGKHTFIGHEIVGAKMVPTIAKRLRWSNAVEDLVTMLIALHLRPGQLFHNTPATTKGINRLYRKAGNNFPALILLALGDLGATKGPEMTEAKTDFLQNKFYTLLSGYFDYCMTTKDMKKLLDGNEIMHLLNLPPGKELGELIQALQEAQEAKEILNRAQAVNFVRGFYNQKKNG